MKENGTNRCGEKVKENDGKEIWGREKLHRLEKLEKE